MFELYECPNCGKDTAAFVSIDGFGGPVRCPACAPTPDKEPHEYRPAEGRFTKAARTGEQVEGMVEIYYGGRVLKVSVELLRDPQFPVGTFILRKLVDR